MTTSRTHRHHGGIGALFTAAALAATLAGCSMKDAVCRGGEYPVMTVGDTGSACVTNGKPPPEGYARYPEGKVPKHVDDTWDVYWRTHTLDSEGNTVDAPAPR
ncbi:SCO0607 family lipoprotein [Streptomyces sp. NPDC058611]|uniref:SCO0607 family lipoprotein n=1 Tax=unclassified Streptomyces TaxID=2593676 RepID=UPI00366303D5